MQDRNGHTALHLASKKGHTDIAKLLLNNLEPEQRLHSISIKNCSGTTALHLASKGGHTDIAKLLLNYLEPEQRLHSISIKNCYGTTALHLASKGGHTAVVKLILAYFERRQQLQLIFMCQYGNTALHLASRGGHTDTMKVMLDHLTSEQQMQLIFTKNRSDETALHEMALLGGDTNILNILLDKLMPEQQLQLIFMKANQNQTALHNLASKKHSAAGIKVMLGYLMPEQQLQLISIKDYLSRTALHLASKNGRADTVKAILVYVMQDQQLKLIYMKDLRDRTAIQLASQESRIDTMKALLNNLTPEQQLQFISKIKKYDWTAKNVRNWIEEQEQKSKSVFLSKINSIKKSFQESYMLHGVKDFKSQLPHLSALAEVYESKFKINQQWQNALKTFTLYNSAAVTFSSSPDDPWNMRAWKVFEMYFNEDCNNNAETFYQNVEDLQKKLGSIRTELKSQITELEKKIRGAQNQAQHVRQEIQQLIEDSNEMMKEFAALIVKKSVECLKDKPPCVFSVVGIGSLGRGEATPYSDIEYLILIQKACHTEYFEKLAVMTYFYIGALRETKLSSLDIEELAGWYVDSRAHGYQIDGITKSSGNVPTGNTQHPNRFIATPTALSTLYKRTFKHPDPDVAIKGDVTAMLKFTSLVYSYDIKESLLKKFEAVRRSIDKKMNSDRKTVSLIMLCNDLRQYEFSPEFDEYSAGFKLNAKVMLYRLPSLILLDSAIITGSAQSDSWQTLEYSVKKFSSEKSFYCSLQFLLSYASYSRLRCYLFMDSKSDEFAIDNNNETGSDVIRTWDRGERKLVFAGRHLWRIATEEFYILIKRLIDMQSHLSALNELTTVGEMKQITQTNVNENPHSSTLAHFYSCQWHKLVESGISTNDLNICYAVAHSHLQLKNYESALRLYERLNLPDNKKMLQNRRIKLVDVYRGMGRCYEGMGKLVKAKKMYELALKRLIYNEAPKEKALIRLESAKVLMLLFPNRSKPLQILFQVLKELILYSAMNKKPSNETNGKSNYGLIEDFDTMSFEDRLNCVSNPSREIAHCVDAIGEIFAQSRNEDISQLYFTKSRSLGLKMVIDKNFDGKTKVAVLTDLCRKFSYKRYLDTASEISRKFLGVDGQADNLECEIILTQGELLAEGSVGSELEQLPEDKLLKNILFDAVLNTTEDIQDVRETNHWYKSAKRKLDKAHPNDPYHIDYGRFEKTMADLAKCNDENPETASIHYGRAYDNFTKNHLTLNAARVLVDIAQIKEVKNHNQAHQSLREAQGFMEEAYGKEPCCKEYADLVSKRASMLRKLAQDEEAKVLEDKSRKIREALSQEEESLNKYISLYRSKDEQSYFSSTAMIEKDMLKRTLEQILQTMLKDIDNVGGNETLQDYIIKKQSNPHQ